jgi:hypothetical protein
LPVCEINHSKLVLSAVKCLIPWVVVFVSLTTALPQPPLPQFRNLEFDEASTNNVHFDVWTGDCGYGHGFAADLLPGWTLLRDSEIITNVWFNTEPLDADYAAIFDQCVVGSFPLNPQGKYALSYSFRHAQFVAQLTQIGQIPPNARYLSYIWALNPAQLNIDDQIWPPLPPGSYVTGQSSGLLAFDMGSVAGKTVRLSLTLGNGALDSIEFITEPPSLSVKRLGDQLILRWPAVPRNFFLQSTAALASAETWEYVTVPPVSLAISLLSLLAPTRVLSFTD